MRPSLDVRPGSAPAGAAVLQEEFERRSPKLSLLPYFCPRVLLPDFDSAESPNLSLHCFGLAGLLWAVNQH